MGVSTLFSFKFTDSKYFITQKINNELVFLEFLIKGKIDIYYNKDNSGKHYYISKSKNDITELKYEEGIKTINGKEIAYTSKEHIGILNYFLQDAPNLKSKINKIKKPKHKNLISLAEEYHNSVCDTEKCLIYQKPKPALTINIELLSGLVNFNNVQELEDKFYFQNGIIANIWMPRTNEKLYFRTGLLYSKVIQEETSKVHLKIPIHLGYLAPKNFKIRPSFSFGLINPSYTFGLQSKFTERIDLGIQNWWNFLSTDQFFLFPNELFNYSILATLYYSFK